MSVKPNAFNALKLPFRIVHGHIGLIDASVPWMNIYSEPILIKISDVFVVAVSNSEVTFNEEEEKQFEWTTKKSYLENIENMKQKIKDGKLSICCRSTLNNDIFRNVQSTKARKKTMISL